MRERIFSAQLRATLLFNLSGTYYLDSSFGLEIKKTRIVLHIIMYSGCILAFSWKLSKSRDSTAGIASAYGLKG
jgi:hypothetical protein